MTVYAVLYCNYGDQGVDFCGVFATKEAAQRYIDKREQNVQERQWFQIEDCEVSE